MTAGKNHHYVPQFYFRRFSRDGKSVCCLIRSNGRVLPNASIKGQASRTLFYGDAEVEKTLSQIEGICSSALRALDATDDPAALPPERSHEVLTHLALQHSRTQAARQASRPFLDRMMQLWLEVAINKDNETDEESKVTLRKLLPNVEADPVQAQRVAMGIAMKMVPTISDLRPLVLVNKTNRPFIFSDAPVIFYNAACFDVRLRGVLGMASFGLLVLMPLGSNRYLMLVDESAYSVRGVRNNVVAVRELKDVRTLNKLQLHVASNCVYFEDPKFERYVHALWQEESRQLKSHEGRVVQAPSFDARTGEERGEILHGFNPQVPYRAHLSFLSHQRYDDSNLPALTRPTCYIPDERE